MNIAKIARDVWTQWPEPATSGHYLIIIIMYHGIRQKIQYIYSNVTSIITFLIISWLCAAGAAIDDVQQGGLTRAQSGLRSACPLVDSFLCPRSRPLVASILLIIMGLGQVVADNIALII